MVSFKGFTNTGRRHLILLIMINCVVLVMVDVHVIVAGR